MSNIIDALSLLRTQLSNTISLKGKMNILTLFKDQELLKFLILYQYGNTYQTHRDTTIKRRRVLEGKKKEWWNYPLPSEKIPGTFKRFQYLKRILENNSTQEITEKLEKLKRHSYAQEWDIYKKILNKTFFSDREGSFLPFKILQKVFKINENKTIKFMRCGSDKVLFPCFIEPKLAGMRTKIIITEDSFSVYTVFNNRVKDITYYFPRYDLPPMEIDGIIRSIKFEGDQKGLINNKVPSFFAYDCYTSENLPLRERKKLLIKIATLIPHIKVLPFIEIDTLEQAIKFRNNCVNKGYKGAITKQINSFYEKTYSEKWTDISFKELKPCKIIEVIGDFEQYSFIAVHKGAEQLIKIKEHHRSLLWQQRHSLLGKYCCIDENNCFVKFDPNKV